MEHTVRGALRLWGVDLREGGNQPSGRYGSGETGGGHWNPFWPERDSHNKCERLPYGDGLGGGEDPIAAPAARRYIATMNLILLIIVLLLLFGGGGFYIGGPVVGGSGLGLVLLICLIVFLMGGFRAKS